MSPSGTITLPGLEHWTRAEYRQRAEQIRSQISENGISFNRYALKENATVGWELDLLPTILPAAEWKVLRSGLEQRLQLLQRLLLDLYTERESVKAGVIPPELLFSSKGFQRPVYTMDSSRIRDILRLSIMSSDVYRTVGGSAFQVFQDKIQSPSGMGYALQNRRLMSHNMNELFESMDVERYYSFFDAYRKMLQAHCRVADREPLIVLFSSGPGNETWYEQAWMANYLGITLVQAQDLEVRRARVYLKSLSGRRQVDVILRRIEDDWLDPLELKADSVIGIPGLLEAMRAGHVHVVNPPGSGLLEDKAIFSLLPDLAEFFLGSRLVLEQVRTFWAAATTARQELFDNQARIVLKKRNRRANDRNLFGPDYSRSDWQDLILAISPTELRLWVGQYIFEPEIVPICSDGNPAQGRQLLRTYSILDREQITTMPGALARVSSDLDSQIITNQAGASSKDVWVLQAQKIIPFTTEVFQDDFLLQEQHESRRTAENDWWLGRYLYRLDFQLRLVHAGLIANLPVATSETITLWAKLISTNMSIPVVADWLDFQQITLLDKGKAGTLLYHSVQLEHNVAETQNVLSHEFKLLLRRLIHALRQLAELPAGQVHQNIATIEHLIMYIQVCHGFIHQRMLRNLNYGFVLAGTAIEALDRVIRMALHPKLPVGAHPNAVHYLQEYDHMAPVLRWSHALLHTSFPFSLPGILAQLSSSLQILAPEKQDPLRLSFERLEALRAAIPVHQAPDDPIPAGLNPVLEWIQTFTDTMQQTWFADDLTGMQQQSQAWQRQAGGPRI
ncbi:MAG: circularly permuted type 2 ATP-grasp protein [Leptospiraceae bacterium]|nr:circularly permuted type 2 ATP-grasp protein [Leptospiraceae bacterium]